MSKGGFVVPALQRLRGSGLDTCNGSDFVRLRIALWAKITALLGGMFYVTGVGIARAFGLAPLWVLVTHRDRLSHLAGIVVCVLVWLVCRYSRFTVAMLGVLDAIGLVCTCAAWAGVVSLGNLWSMQPAMLAVTLTVLGRAVFVPSKPARTLRLSLLGFVPTLLVAIWWARSLPIPAGFPRDSRFASVISIDQYLWALAAVALATIMSQVIYGLRRSVREANELGQYTLEEKLGSGGMGEVWRAHHRLLVRAAAVKLIRPEPLLAGHVAPEVLLRRFEREARATAGLRSPHTVQLFDFGQAEDGTLYYVMEMLVGLDLENLVSRFGPMPAERAIHILRQVCASLHEAHHNGLTHRDIKPANIFVSRVGTELDFAKVLDFGLVRLRHDRPGGDDVKLTAEGAASGTPAYMAPEIVLGQPYDHRVDIYAVGCVAYWLLTGKLVFEGDGPIKVMLDHAQTTPPRPQTRTELPIPPELEQIVMDCLEKDRSRRPATAADLSMRLAACKTPEEWTCQRAERWWQTHMPQQVAERPIAEALLSRESAPPREWRELRPRPRRANLG
ncbi:MAG TPA: serine/threonine-protein kinase [Polyangia bacterium]|nr:serine/threonine-protein kinase [Polyangia bacterium]